jgi:hypothetical protein
MLAKLVLSLIILLKIHPCNNAKYIKMGHDIRDTLKDTGRL